jgi:peptide/nickel transport system permease protein
VRAYLIRRVLGAIPLLLGISAVSFGFMYAMPGGPDALLARNSRLSPEQLAAIRHNLGLDEPVWLQFVKWLLNLLRGDLGISFTEFRPVNQIIAERIPHTFKLVLVAIVLSLVIAVLSGILAAIRQYSLFDHLVSTLSFFGLAMPVFWFGLMLQLLFAVRLGWLPSADMSSPGGGFWDTIKHMALPAFTLAVGTVAGWSRYVRSSMLEVVHQDYIRTARAKGVAERGVIWVHALKNALIPFVTVVALDIPFYLTGAVVTEAIFSWPGLGRLFFDSLRARDYPVLMGLLVFSAVLIVLFNIVADLIYGLLDPRISYEKAHA